MLAVSLEALTGALSALSKRDVTARLVLVAASAYRDTDSGALWVSRSRLARVLGLSDRTVRRAWQRLEAAGVLVEVPRPGRSERRAWVVTDPETGQRCPRLGDPETGQQCPKTGARPPRGSTRNRTTKHPKPDNQAPETGQRCPPKRREERQSVFLSAPREEIDREAV